MIVVENDEIKKNPWLIEMAKRNSLPVFSGTHCPGCDREIAGQGPREEIAYTDKEGWSLSGEPGPISSLVIKNLKLK
jgi:hypothetical protein